MHASITAQKNGMVVAVLDAEAAQVTFACVIFAARIHEEIAPLARIVEQQLQIEGIGVVKGDDNYAGDPSRTR
ncbi:MAG TPA: hypothetical protein VMU57_04825 [Edaphobacter sp.]|uniref:hypothetical protein n=1 Tax=Edaphobacter sp. TaxID=1934404 RepID=UPI002BA7276C|nr:hypothetical protein [Edaphobacter sp.]HUZ94217.1 hypothetical protein [Edaphobacter sp.]